MTNEERAESIILAALRAGDRTGDALVALGEFHGLTEFEISCAIMSMQSDGRIIPVEVSASGIVYKRGQP